MQEDIQKLKDGLNKDQRLLGLDVGTKTIGLALSDTRLSIASPLSTIRRKKFTLDAIELLEIMAEHDIGGLVIGFPLNMDVQRAYQIGYVNKVVPVADLMPTAMEWARKIAATAPMPSRMIKRFVYETMPKGPTEQAAIARVQVEDINDSA